MIAISGTWVWVPFYAALVAWLYFNIKERVVTVVLFALIILAFTDSISFYIIKEFFKRLRPCHEVAYRLLVHAPADCGGEYGFVSNHAANTFGLAFFLWILLRKHFPAIRWMFVWAGIVSYSRIYLGKHYPADIIGGMLLGAAVAFVVYRVYTYFALRAGYSRGKYWVRKWMDLTY